MDLGDPALRAHGAERLTEINRGAGSAHRIQRLLLLATPPDIDAGEITDKRYINHALCSSAVTPMSGASSPNPSQTT